MSKFNPMVIEKPWGKEVIWAHTPEYIGKILHINAGESLSIQFHHVKDETMHVMSGTGTINFYTMLDDGDVTVRESIQVNKGISVHVPPNQIHNVHAETDLVILEASTTHLTDLVRIKDRYGRN
jgi:mannose-6-phosphate isomerase-like protein (cupin superfamily)